VIGATGDPQSMNLHFQTQIPAGRQYQVEWSDDFVTWNPQLSGTGTGQLLNLQATVANRPNRYYRLRVLGQ
jgi:hypothetical protein